MCSVISDFSLIYIYLFLYAVHRKIDIYSMCVLTTSGHHLCGFANASRVGTNFLGN